MNASPLYAPGFRNGKPGDGVAGGLGITWAMRKRSEFCVRARRHKGIKIPGLLWLVNLPFLIEEEKSDGAEGDLTFF